MARTPLSMRHILDILRLKHQHQLSVREIARWFGSTFGREPRLVGTEGPVALLSDASRCRAQLGEPEVPLTVLQQWVAHWVQAGGASLNKPTHFEVTDGRF